MSVLVEVFQAVCEALGRLPDAESRRRVLTAADIVMVVPEPTKGTDEDERARAAAKEEAE